MSIFKYSKMKPKYLQNITNFSVIYTMIKVYQYIYFIPIIFYWNNEKEIRKMSQLGKNWGLFKNRTRTILKTEKAPRPTV